MRDGFDDAIAETPRACLTYPFETGPTIGEAVDVAPGIKWLRMPLGGSLAFINVWAIREGEGWAKTTPATTTEMTAASPNCRNFRRDVWRRSTAIPASTPRSRPWPAADCRPATGLRRAFAHGLGFGRTG